MSDRPKSLNDLFDSEDGQVSLPDDIPKDTAKMRESIGEMLGFKPEDAKGGFTRLETAEIYAALVDAGYKKPTRDFCDKVERGMQKLLDNGKTMVKASEIANHGSIDDTTDRTAAGRVGYNLRFGMCNELDSVGFEIIVNDNQSNDYKLWWK